MVKLWLMRIDMVKKIVFICLLIAFCVGVSFSVHSKYVRKYVEPDFFIPAKDKFHQQEKLPPLPKNFIKENYYERLSYAVSVDSADPKIHNRFRGCEHAFEKTVEAIGNIVENGMSCGITYSTYDGNEFDIECMIKFCKQNKIKHMKINPIVKMGRAENFDDEYSMTTISPEKILKI